MRSRKVSSWAAGALAIAALAGCSGGGGGSSSPNNARISVSLTDAPVDGVTAVHVRITAVWVKPASGPPVELPLVNAPFDVNLLGLTDTNAAVLIDEAVVAPGSYEWLAMDVAAQPNVRDSYVMTDTGGEEDLFMPSDRLRLVDGFEVGPNEAVQLLFDWDLRQALVYPPGLGRYLLKPAFRLIDVTEYGVLEGTIAAATIGESVDAASNNCATDGEDLDVGNVVYVFSGALQADELNDVDGSGDPVATIEAKREANGDYTYRTLIAPNTYTVVFTCEGGNDDPEDTDEITFLDPEGTTNPIVNTGNTTTVNF